MSRWTAPLVFTLAWALAPAAEPGAGDDWWNAAWSHRKRVRVRLAAEEPLGFRYRPPAAGADDLVAAEARIRCEIPLKAPAQREIRVVDPGGNVLPCAAEDPDARGLVRVTFPARRTITGQLASPIQDGTKTVTLSVGRDKAVLAGTRFYALAGAVRIATLEVESVAAKTSVARVVDKTTPNIAQGIPVESDVLTAAEYFIYYGNPKPEGDAPAWTPNVPSLVVYGWQITDGQFLNQLEEARGTYRIIPADQVRAAMRNSPSYLRSATLSVIDNRANPLNYESGYHISVYESYVYCDVAGIWRFSVDSAAPAYLFIDGKLVAQRPSFFYQVAGNFEHRGKIELQEGYHHLIVCAAETAKHNTRLGWQTPTQTVFSPVPASFFVNRIAAETVGFETRDRREQVFFSHKLAPLSVVTDGGSRHQFVQFENLTTLRPKRMVEGVEQAAPIAYVWDFGDGVQCRERFASHLYATSGRSGPPSFKVTLSAFVDSKLVGQYQDVVHCEPRPEERLNVSLDIVSFANVVYYDEHTSIAVRLRNTAFCPVVVRAVGRMETRKGREVIVNQELPIEGKNENFCVLPVDMKQLPDKTALIELDVLVGSERVLQTAARIVPSLDLLRKGDVSLEGGQAILGPGGPLNGLVWTGGELPTTNYDLLLRLKHLAGLDLCSVTFPVGSNHCTLRSRAWDITPDPGRSYELRLRVSDAKVEAWLDGRKVEDVSRRSASAALPLAAEAMRPFGVHASLSTKVAVSAIAVAKFDGAPPPPPPGPKGADDTSSRKRWRRPAEAPKAPAAPPAPAPPTPPPDQDKWTALFDGAARNWRAVAENDLNLLQRGLGSLHDCDGRRVMISAEIEDADRHLEWVFARYIHEKHLASRRSVLLFGDRMANAAEPGESFTDYVALLEARLTKAQRPFQFVERATGLLPTVPDMALFARTLQAAKELPDIIVICPGLSDVQQAVGDRDFARSFDVMIDFVRATGRSIKIVLVSPPPCPRNERIARLYTEAAQRIARDHHIQFLDLNALLSKGQDDWVQAWYAVPDAEGLFYDNPNEAAHHGIADAIEKLLTR